MLKLISVKVASHSPTTTDEAVHKRTRLFNQHISEKKLHSKATSWNSLAAYKAVNGVCSAVLITTVLPHANAGPTFQANMRRGKFHGIIWPATPIGSCKVCTWCCPSAGTTRPWILSAQPKQYSKENNHEYYKQYQSKEYSSRHVK